MYFKKMQIFTILVDALFFIMQLWQLIYMYTMDRIFTELP